MLLLQQGPAGPAFQSLRMWGGKRASTFLEGAPRSFFALIGGMGVLTFFQLVKILGNTVARQEPINLTKEFNKSL